MSCVTTTTERTSTTTVLPSNMALCACACYVMGVNCVFVSPAAVDFLLFYPSVLFGGDDSFCCQ